MFSATHEPKPPSPVTSQCRFSLLDNDGNGDVDSQASMAMANITLGGAPVSCSRSVGEHTLWLFNIAMGNGP